MEASLELHTSAITSISFHPELYFVSVGSADGTFSIWNLETFQPQFHSKNFNTPIDSVQFCGNRIVAAADHTLHAYELKHLSEDGLTTIRTPWTLVSDIVFASFADELWFVETSGTTAMTGKLGFSTPTVAPPVVEHKTVRSNPVPQARPREQAPVVKRPPVDTRRDTPEIPRTTSVDVNAAANDGVLTINMHVSEAQVADQLVLTSAKVNAVLHSRLTNLKAVYALWAQDPKSALAHLERSCEEGTDAGAILDFLMAIQQPHMREKFPSEAYPNLLNVIVFALCATEDNVVRASLQAFDCINRQYRARLGEARRRAKASMSNGHNNPLDATVNANIQQKINECYEIAVCLADRNDEIGVVAKEIISSLE
ncbi:katanin [Angomonas deanei]|nr:katanin [Angomonas deanei]|eukprot:EPY27213.1 katanin [Angomonas deanei]